MRWLVRRFVAWLVEREAEKKCKPFSEPWVACKEVASIFRDEYKYK